MLKQFNQNRPLLFLLVSSFVLFFSIAFFSEASYDAGDGIRHYQISKYSWSHPELFLDSWGKPFYTILSSPFSQFGFGGITFFNIACGVFSAFIVYKIAKKLNYSFSLLAIPFLLFAPIYFPTMNSGLTEPFFGLVLIGSIFLMLEKKYFWACLLVSFLPFVRAEGIIVLPLFFILLVYNRSYWNILILGCGTLVYSIIGFFYYGDFLWIKNQNPYNGANKEFYGHGELFSFIKDYNEIWGFVLGLLFLTGSIAIISGCFSKNTRLVKKGKFSSFFNEENILILGSFFLYFVAHSIMWWQGLANSLGLIRVFAAIMPCSAINCLRGFNFIVTPLFFRTNTIKIGGVCLVLLFVILCPFKNDNFPYKLSKEQAVIKEAGIWIKENGLVKNKLYFQYPYLAILLDVDPFDKQKVADLWGVYPTIKKHGIGAVRDSSVLIWDAHFGPNECRIPLDTLMFDQNFDLLKTFYPKEQFNAMSGIPFQVSVFMKMKTPKKKERLPETKLAFELLNSEKDVYVLKKEMEFGFSFNKNISELPKKTKSVTFSGKIIDPLNNCKNALVVLIIEDASGKNIFWEGKPVSLYPDSPNEKPLLLNFKLIAEAFQPTNVIKTYVWNRDKKYFYLADYKIEYWGN